MKSTLFVWLAAAVCPAAELATVRGRVTDPSGALVSGARVTLRGAADAAGYSDASGRYVLRIAPGGPYRLAVEAAGFQTFARERLALRAGEVRSIDAALELSPVAERITVSAKAPALEGGAAVRPWNHEEVLEIREVRESFARDVGEALARLDGLAKIRKGGIAGDVVLRGFQRDNLGVILDGARIQGACPNRMDPPAFHVDFAEIAQVTVTKGPFDVREAGSLGGVVRVETRPPEPGWRFAPSLAAGSFGYYNPSLTASYAGERFSLLAGYAYRRSRPFADGSGRLFTAYANYTPAARNLDAFDIGTGWLRLSGEPARGHRLSLAYTRQNAGGILYPYLMMDAGYDRAHRLGASYSARALRARAYFTEVRHWMTDELRASAAGLPRPYSMATLAGTRMLGARAEADFSWGTAGVETYRRVWNAVNTMRMAMGYMDQAAIPNVAATAGGAFAEYRRSLSDRLRLTAGARLDGARALARSPAANTALYWAYQDTRSLEHVDVAPSGHVRLAYSLSRGLELFAGAGHTVRFADPQERYIALQRSGSDWVGNPELQSTANDEIDVGVNYRGRRFTLRPTVYDARVSNYITPYNQRLLHPLPSVMNTAARSYANIDARLYGGELSWGIGLTPALLLSGGASYTRGLKRSLPGNLAEIPPLRARAGLRYGTKRWFAEVEGQAAHRQARVDMDLREPPTPGYAVLNVKAGARAGKLRLAAGVENLLDRFYWEHLSYQRDPFRSGLRVPEPGRNWFVSLTCGF